MVIEIEGKGSLKTIKERKYKDEKYE